MARWIGAVGCLLLVGVAAAQLVEHPNLAGHPSEVISPEVSPVLQHDLFNPALQRVSGSLVVQEVPVAQEPVYPTPTPISDLPAAAYPTDPAGNPVSPYRPYPTPVYQPVPYPAAIQATQYAPVPQPDQYTPPAQEGPAASPYPVYPEPVAPPLPYGSEAVIPRTTLDVVEAPIDPLEIVVYSVADLVVGQDAGADANQALLSMLAQQSEEMAMALNAAAAGGGESQQQVALSELAQTIKSTFAAEFNDERASITLHRNTMSLIVRQSEDVHEQIRDLLNQLRSANDTEIKIMIELVEMDEARSAFAFAHNGQILDEATAQEFRQWTLDGTEKLTFNLTTRNGESTSLPAYGLPGTLTAVASHDRSEVRVLLDMFWGMETGMTQKHNHRIPTGETILTIFTVEDSGYVVLLSAEIEGQEELEDALSGPEDAALLPATHAEPAPPAEPVSQTRRPLIGTQKAFVEVDALPENFLEQLLERFDGEILVDSEPYAAVLQSATANDVVLAMQEDHADLRIIRKPQTSWGSSGGEGSLHVGRDVPVIYGIAFEDDGIVPLARHHDIGIWLNSVFTVTDDGSIESRVHVTRKKVLDEEVVVYSSPDQTITSPVIGSATASTTFTVPQGKTVVWPVPPIGGAESDGSTLLILLTSQVRGDADHAE